MEKILFIGIILVLSGCTEEIEQPQKEEIPNTEAEISSPILKLSTYLLTFKPGETEKSFTITNAGGGVLEGTIMSDIPGRIFDKLPGVVAAPSAFSLKAGESVTIKVKVRVRRSGSLIIETNVGKEVISVVVE